MLSIIGGSYIENCIDPTYHELYGSGLRAAAALSNKGFKIGFHSCICKKYEPLAILKSHTFGYTTQYHSIPKTIEFDYYHPLSTPIPIIEQDLKNIEIENIESEHILYYGMIEADAKFNGNFVVYDPQNNRSFNETGSTARHLALILNKKEAISLSKIKTDDLITAGKNLMISENAELIVIKNGVHGALIFEEENVSEIPVFETESVWPIGSGDIFSAVFAWKWMIEHKLPYDSAYEASQFTAHYCKTRQFPLVNSFPSMKELANSNIIKNIYLAGPFFSIAERWLINELHYILTEFGNNVFSPFHDIGVIEPTEIISKASYIADEDLKELTKCDTVLAVVTGLDAGTLFEIGYAKSLNKKVVILAQNVSENDLTMLIGTDCEITGDFSSAIYKASW